MATPQQSKPPMTGAQIAGIALASVALIAVFTSLGVCVMWITRRKSQQKYKSRPYSPDSSSTASSGYHDSGRAFYDAEKQAEQQGRRWPRSSPVISSNGRVNISAPTLTAQHTPSIGFNNSVGTFNIQGYHYTSRSNSRSPDRQDMKQDQAYGAAQRQFPEVVKNLPLVMTREPVGAHPISHPRREVVKPLVPRQPGVHSRVTLRSQLVPLRLSNSVALPTLTLTRLTQIPSFSVPRVRCPVKMAKQAATKWAAARNLRTGVPRPGQTLSSQGGTSPPEYPAVVPSRSSRDRSVAGPPKASLPRNVKDGNEQPWSISKRDSQCSLTSIDTTNSDEPSDQSDIGKPHAQDVVIDTAVTSPISNVKYPKVPHSRNGSNGSNSSMLHRENSNRSLRSARLIRTTSSSSSSSSSHTLITGRESPCLDEQKRNISPTAGIPWSGPESPPSPSTTPPHLMHPIFRGQNREAMWKTGKPAAAAAVVVMVPPIISAVVPSPTSGTSDKPFRYDGLKFDTLLNLMDVDEHPSLASETRRTSSPRQQQQQQQRHQQKHYHRKQSFSVPFTFPKDQSAPVAWEAIPEERLSQVSVHGNKMIKARLFGPTPEMKPDGSEEDLTIAMVQ